MLLLCIALFGPLSVFSPLSSFLYLLLLTPLSSPFQTPFRVSGSQCLSAPYLLHFPSVNMLLAFFWSPKELWKMLQYFGNTFSFSAVQFRKHCVSSIPCCNREQSDCLAFRKCSQEGNKCPLALHQTTLTIHSASAFKPSCFYFAIILFSPAYISS